MSTEKITTNYYNEDGIIAQFAERDSLVTPEFSGIALFGSVERN